MARMKKKENVLKRRVLRSGLNEKEIKTNYRKKYVFNWSWNLFYS